MHWSGNFDQLNEGQELRVLGSMGRGDRGICDL
jgi:hypothetical protein